MRCRITRGPPRPSSRRPKISRQTGTSPRRQTRTNAAGRHLDAGGPQWLATGHALVECWEKTGTYASIIPLVEAMRWTESFSADPRAPRTLDYLFFAYLNECDWSSARGVTEQMATLASDASSAFVRAQLVLAYACGRTGHQTEGTRLMRGIKPKGLADDESRWRYSLAALALDAGRKPLRTLLARADRAAELGRKVGAAAVAYAYTEGVELALRHGEGAGPKVQRSRRRRCSAQQYQRGREAASGAREERARASAFAPEGSPMPATVVISNLGWRDREISTRRFTPASASSSACAPAIFQWLTRSSIRTARRRGFARRRGAVRPPAARIRGGHAGSRDDPAPLKDALRACAGRGLVDPQLSIPALRGPPRSSRGSRSARAPRRRMDMCDGGTNRHGPRLAR